MKMSKMSKLKILLVDDDEIDYMNLKRAFKKNDLHHDLLYKQNGQEAIDFLEEVKVKSELPQVIILDINMPKMNGHEFLNELRSNEELKHIVVYVLTTSAQDSDIELAYSNQVSGYLVKPLEFTEFKDTISKLNELWKIQKFYTSNR